MSKPFKRLEPWKDKGLFVRWDAPRLSGRPVRDGEALEVQFPDGHVEELKAAVVEKSSGSCDGHSLGGVTYYHTWYEVEAAVVYHGVTFRLPLEGMPIRRKARAKKSKTKEQTCWAPDGRD